MVNDQLDTTQRQRKDLTFDSKFFDHTKTQYSNSKLNSQNINNSQFSSTFVLAQKPSSKSPIQWINLKLNKKVMPEVPENMPVRQKRFAASVTQKTHSRAAQKQPSKMKPMAHLENYKSPYQQKKDPYYVDYMSSFFKPESREASVFEFEKSDRWQQTGAGAP